MEAKEILSRASLIHCDPELGSTSVHRLVQEATMSRMSTKERSLIFNQVVILLHASFPDFENHPGHSFSAWPQCHKILPHVMKLASISNSVDLSSSAGPTNTFVDLLLNCSW